MSNISSLFTWFAESPYQYSGSEGISSSYFWLHSLTCVIFIGTNNAHSWERNVRLLQHHPAWHLVEILTRCHWPRLSHVHLRPRSSDSTNLISRRPRNFSCIYMHDDVYKQRHFGKRAHSGMAILVLVDALLICSLLYLLIGAWVLHVRSRTERSMCPLIKLGSTQICHVASRSVSSENTASLWMPWRNVTWPDVITWRTDRDLVLSQRQTRKFFASYRIYK